MDPHLGKTANAITKLKKLGPNERREIRRRAKRYQRRLEAKGYEVRVLEDTTGVFASLTVFDPATDRHGFVDSSGKITWLKDLQGLSIGALQHTVQSQPIDLGVRKKRR